MIYNSPGNPGDYRVYLIPHREKNAAFVSPLHVAWKSSSHLTLYRSDHSPFHEVFLYKGVDADDGKGDKHNECCL